METTPRCYHQENETLHYSCLPYYSSTPTQSLLQLDHRRLGLRARVLTGTQRLESGTLSPCLLSPIYIPYTRDIFPRLAYSLVDIDRKEKPHTRDDPMIYAPSRVRDEPKKKAYGPGTSSSSRTKDTFLPASQYLLSPLTSNVSPPSLPVLRHHPPFLR